MKKIIFLSLILVPILSLISCKNEKKEKKESEINKKNFTVDIKNTTLNWVAYKTTDKIPVKGQFTSFSILNPKKGITVIDALNGLEFSIPINSLHTNDTIRDGKLKKFFFGNMLNTSEIKGILHMEKEASGNAEITMNGISQKFPFTYIINNQKVTIEATIDLNNWKAQSAIEALNLACNDLHKGADGVSKTWSEVKLEIVTTLKN